MLKIITVLLPMFIIIAMGYVLALKKVFSTEALAGFGRFVIAVALPALVFKATASKPIEEIFRAPYLFGYGLASVFVFVFGFALAKLRGQPAMGCALDGVGGTYSNSSFIGYPLLVGVIGSASADLYFALNVLFECLVLIPLFLAIAEYIGAQAQGRKPQIRPLLVNMLKKPLIIALAAGLLFSLMDWRLPVPLEKVIDILAGAAAPLALFIIGGGLCGLKLSGSMADIIQITVFKLLLLPAAAALFVWLFGGSNESIFAAALMGGVATANTTVIFCQFYGHPHRGTASMLLSTVLSIFTLSVILYLHSL